MTETKIENCNFSFKCPKEWSSLIDDGLDKQRYCDSCEEYVHWCNSQEEIDEAVSKNWCVAFSRLPKNNSLNWDSKHDGFLEFHMGRLDSHAQGPLNRDNKESVISSINHWLTKIFVKR